MRSASLEGKTEINQIITQIIILDQILLRAMIKNHQIMCALGAGETKTGISEEKSSELRLMYVN